jgi:hypothetical protein
VWLIKQAASDARLDPSHFAGHSLRAGHATAAGNTGTGLPELMGQIWHKSTEWCWATHDKRKAVLKVAIQLTGIIAEKDEDGGKLP